MNMENKDGSSLIEVIVAMVILALLVTGLNACVVNLINSNVSSKELAAATSAGNQLLEEFRRINYSSIVSDFDLVRNKYVRSWTVTADSAQKKIVLVVSWPPVSGRKSIQLSTIVARP
jgi:prepilin-type N-terminal cleavage/methylation domain-containing protein